ncbi:CBS domain-containing protein [Streptomyces sp. NBC_01320]|uniref:CBS domain-containing protein n=1 Tax=Streptomyces sp. NBC_01320 TaxID=2903824 RepID=UPI002E13426F|nr:CBS domain-containing protein [Streptomyces sp. NBC_01320]
MKHITVGDLMTDEVVSVVSANSFKDVAKLLAQHNISGLPVLDSEDRVVGVISESDLLVRQTGTGPATGTSPEGAGRPTATTAGEVMSSPAVTVLADETVTGAARLMKRRGVERLPVVDEEGRLIGIVTRRDLLGLFLRPDAEIRRRVVEDVLVDTMGLRADVVAVHVVDGVVTLEGELERQSEIPVLIRLTEQLDGVVAVMSHLTTRLEDGRLRPPERTAHPMW